MYRIDSKATKPDINYLKQRVIEMMQRGIAVGDLVGLADRFTKQRDDLANDIKTTYGILNPNSSKQLVEYISSLDSGEVYGVCCIEGKWTTNKDAFGTLALLGYQFASDILEYRKAKKYAESVVSMLDAIGADGRVHPTVSLSKTNRINYSSPALMNIPKDLLWNIVAPSKPGNVLISADIKNQEPSILINILNADNLKKALVDDRGLYESLFSEPFKIKARLNILVVSGHKTGYISNTDLANLGYVPPVYYTPTIPCINSAFYNNEQIRYIDITNIIVNPGDKDIDLPSKVVIETTAGKQYSLSVSWDKFDKRKLNTAGIIEVDGELDGIELRCEGVARKEFKVAWNAMTYGASLYGVKQMCKNIDGELVYQYFSKIPEFKKYRAGCRKLADAGSQYINTYFGTTLCADETNPNKLQRVLMDLPIQGTAADILSLLIKHCDEEIEKDGLIGKLSIYYTRHDEIIFEADKSLVDTNGIDWIKSKVLDMVEHQVDNWTPFKVEVDEVSGVDILDNVLDDIFE